MRGIKVVKVFRKIEIKLKNPQSIKFVILDEGPMGQSLQQMRRYSRVP